VDPPPICELRIFEGEHEENEITFEFNANYFLFATLEQARPIAQGRVTQDPARATVLTGTPVAGIVYLDRPVPAGYFLFPDLSVRHEGLYYLTFNLYEEIKEEKDTDRIEEGAEEEEPRHVTHRLDVKSAPFQVFSAKKFPGLYSSTNLSREVAEQGCRVRIRRDVRMRKRDGKTNGKWNEYEEDTAGDRARQAATPDMYGSMGAPPSVVESSHRPRSCSMSSHVSLAPAPPSRRTSAHDLSHMYQPNAFAPPSAQNGYPMSAPGSAGQVYQQQMMQQSSDQMVMAPPRPVQTHYQPTYASAQQPMQQAYFPYGPNQSRQSYEAQQNGNMIVAEGQSSGYPTTLNYMTQPAYPTASTTDLQPANTSIRPEVPPQSMPASTAPKGPQHLPPLNTSLAPAPTNRLLEASSPHSAVSTHPYTDYSRLSGSTPSEMAGSKRSYGEVFDSRPIHESLRSGARPGSSHNTNIPEHDESEDYRGDESDDANARLHYRRADGRQNIRPLPPVL